MFLLYWQIHSLNGLFQQYYSNQGKTDVESDEDIKNMYNIMQWSYHENTADGCGLTSIGTNMLPSIISCVRTPYKGDKEVKVEVWIFDEDDDRELTVADNSPSIENYPGSIQNYHVPGYQHPCEDDLGGGHWMKGGEDRERNVLIGIQVFSSEPCGRKSRMLKVINKDFLNWIELRICKKWLDCKIS